MKLPQVWSRAVPVFDDEHLLSCAGLVPVMALAEQAGLSELVTDRVTLATLTPARVASAGVNPGGKVAAIIAGMAAGADSIDDLQVVRSGGMRRIFGQVYAPATLGQFLREFTHGHASQLASAARAHLLALAGRTDLLPGIEQVAFVDIDSLLRPVYGHAKQGASFGHTKIAGKQVLRRGLSPLAVTISTETAAPVIAGIRLRAGNAAVCRAIAAIDEDAWIPVHYPGAVTDPDTGALISDAQVAETSFTAFATTDTPLTARLVVRRVRDQAKLDELFPVWRHHPFLTNSDLPLAEADLTHRRHAIIETVFADLIDGPLAHLPSGRFAANHAWAICAAMTHNLLRAAATLADSTLAVARGATLRRRIVNVPARIARPQRRRVLHLPEHWPWATQWLTIWRGVFGHDPPATP